MAALKLTPTQGYRVTAVGVSYLEPVVGYDETGAEVEVLAHRVGHFSEEIQLTEAQARRLEGLGVVKPKDAPLGYQEQTVDQLAAIADERGLKVQGSGANGHVLKEDFVTALSTYDAGNASA